jgi:tRNA G18 (ribose-2'-O)-methylase SpoU
MPRQPVDDPADARLDEYRDLRNGTHRRGAGLFVAEGREVVRRLLATPRFRTRSLLCTAPALEALAPALAAAPDVPVYVARHATIRAVAGFDFHRGCLALGERPPATPLAPLLDAGGRRPRRLVVLEALANPDNVGGVLRNAMAFAADAVLLSPGCADPLYRKTIRVSMGGALAVPFAELAPWPGALGRVRAAGYRLVALTPDPHALDVAALTPADRVALLVGNEGSGLSAGALAAADVAVTIPMADGVDSLNVATAAGIALHRLRAGR